LFDVDRAPAAIRDARLHATAESWRNRAAMMLKADVPQPAYDDYLRALAIDPGDEPSLNGLARTAVLAGRVQDAAERLDAIAKAHPSVQAWIARSKLLAASGDTNGAIDAAREATEIKPLRAAAIEQLAALFSASGDSEQLDVAVQKLKELAPEAASTHHYAAVAEIMKDDFKDAVRLANAAIAADAEYTAAYDVAGAAHLKLGEVEPARLAFESSLRYNPHDSTAYTNLGIIELNRGNAEGASRFFAEALWLDPESTVARQGLTQTKAALGN
jgi:Flp pilus assembly protein TadD